MGMNRDCTGPGCVSTPGSACMLIHPLPVDAVAAADDDERGKPSIMCDSHKQHSSSNVSLPDVAHSSNLMM